MKLSILFVFTIIAALVAAEPKPVKDKALNWEILAKASKAEAIEAQAAALQGSLNQARQEAQAAVKRACEVEKIPFEKCVPRVVGEQITLEQKEDPKPDPAKKPEKPELKKK